MECNSSKPSAPSGSGTDECTLDASNLENRSTFPAQTESSDLTQYNQQQCPAITTSSEVVEESVPAKIMTVSNINMQEHVASNLNPMDSGILCVQTNPMLVEKDVTGIVGCKQGTEIDTGSGFSQTTPATDCQVPVKPQGTHSDQMSNNGSRKRKQNLLARREWWLDDPDDNVNPPIAVPVPKSLMVEPANHLFTPTPKIPKLLYDLIDPNYQQDELYIAFNTRPDPSKTRLCILCYRWYGTDKNLYRHLVKVHRDNMKMYGCNVCGEKFWSSFLRQRHEKLHELGIEDPSRL